MSMNDAQGEVAHEQLMTTRVNAQLVYGVLLAGAFLVRALPDVAGMIFACSALLSLALGVRHLYGPTTPNDETTP